MSDVAIRAEGLSKLYRLGVRERYRTLRDTLTDTLAAPFRRRNGRAPSTDNPETFWALKDVSFEVKHGEVIGIIGRNGAGKSTLLKVLSRITEPTCGEAHIHGRIASLLEVGTGFHPELTGRDNIYLNGAILGMKKAEIRRKFDEIVAFAEVEKFIDTPVKHYSSGMYVRLAFAVAAHLEPEILIVDEVLAVGDAQFQKKCLGKMEDASKREGRTVLFVSHNMSAVQALCGSGLLLHQGRLCQVGPMEDVIRNYSAGLRSDGERHANDVIRLGPALRLINLEVRPRCVTSGGPLSIEIQLLPEKAAFIKELALLIFSDYGIRIAVIDLRRRGVSDLSVNDLPLDLQIDIFRLPLVEGDYRIGLYIVTDEHQGDHLDLGSFSVVPGHGQGEAVRYPAACRGFVEFEFSVDRRFSAQNECLTL